MVYVMSLIFETSIKFVTTTKNIYLYVLLYKMNVMTSNTHILRWIRHVPNHKIYLTGYETVENTKKMLFHWPMFNSRIKYENVWLPGKRIPLFYYDMEYYIIYPKSSSPNVVSQFYFISLAIEMYCWKRW